MRFWAGFACLVMITTPTISNAYKFSSFEGSSTGRVPNYYELAPYYRGWNPERKYYHFDSDRYSDMALNGSPQATYTAMVNLDNAIQRLRAWDGTQQNAKPILGEIEGVVKNIVKNNTPDPYSALLDSLQVLRTLMNYSKSRLATARTPYPPDLAKFLDYTLRPKEFNSTQ